MAKPCRFAILSCEDNEKWTSFSTTVLKNVQGKTNLYVESFVKSFGEVSDSWEVFSCYEAHWPTIEEAKLFDAIFITGSGYSISNKEQQLHWINPLCTMIQIYLQDNRRLIGIGFGAQLLAQALGGSVGKNPGSYIAKIEDVLIQPELSSFLEGDVRSLAMIENHGEQVIDLPPGAVLLGQSNSCKNEIWCLNSALAIQGHPEFDSEVLLKLILPSLKKQRLLSTLDIIHNGRNLRNKDIDHTKVHSLIKDFTRTDSIVSSGYYRSLFSCQPNSYSDKALIKQIEELEGVYANRPYAGEVGEYRNPIDKTIRQFVETSVENLTSQFSTLMLKELKQTMMDYHGLEFGSTLILEDSKVKLSERFELYKPIKKLRSENLFLTKEANQVLKEITIILTSLEESTRLLERETNNLKQRILY